MTTTMLREEMVEASVLQALNEKLPDFGVILDEGPERNADLREAFPTPEERATDLEITTLALGFQIDDGGEYAELGSNLMEYQHTLEVWTFATEPRFGRRAAHAIKHALRHDTDTVPLIDFTQEGNPVIDQLVILKAQVRHQANNSAHPWDRYVWTTSVVVQDYATP